VVSSLVACTGEHVDGKVLVQQRSVLYRKRLEHAYLSGWAEEVVQEGAPELLDSVNLKDPHYDRVELAAEGLGDVLLEKFHEHKEHGPHTHEHCKDMIQLDGHEGLQRSRCSCLVPDYDRLQQEMKDGIEVYACKYCMNTPVDSDTMYRCKVCHPSS